MFSRRKITVFNTFGLKSASGKSSSAELHSQYNPICTNQRMEVSFCGSHTDNQSPAIVARIYHENRFTGGRSGDSDFRGLLLEMKKNRPAIKMPEIVI